MELIVNDSRTIENPTVEDIQQEIDGLGSDEFAILSRGEEFYMQVFHHEDGLWQLEYRAGGAEKHFCANPYLESAETVSQAFVDYAEDGTLWQTLATWEVWEGEG